jgi:ubiquinol-cytochrome c reductase iron-sulfur subunit
MGKHERGPTTAIGWAFIASVAGSIALATTYALGGQPQIEGISLFVALGGVSAGLVLWARRLMPQGPVVQPRDFTFDQPEQREERAEAEESFAAGAEQIGRRHFLGRLLSAALGALGLTLFFPLRSCGVSPGSALYRTSWRRGRRAVTPDGVAVRADALVESSVLTVFPEGHTDAADSQVLLIKTPVGTMRVLPGRESWTPDGIVAFSKICTHAGCPVGLYQAATKQLFCPCHQSVFSVPDAAKPTSGPATRALPQLPLSIDSDGYVVAQSDFLEPVGPEFWRFGAHP